MQTRKKWYTPEDENAFGAAMPQSQMLQQEQAQQPAPSPTPTPSSGTGTGNWVDRFGNWAFDKFNKPYSNWDPSWLEKILPPYKSYKRTAGAPWENPEDNKFKDYSKW